jgi:hypothetical protein
VRTNNNKIKVPDLDLTVPVCQDPTGISAPLDGRGWWELALVERKDTAEGTHFGVCSLEVEGRCPASEDRPSDTAPAKHRFSARW